MRVQWNGRLSQQFATTTENASKPIHSLLPLPTRQLHSISHKQMALQLNGKETFSAFDLDEK